MDELKKDLRERERERDIRAYSTIVVIASIVVDREGSAPLII